MDLSHDQLVKRLAQQVKGFYQRKVPFYIYHGSTNSTRVVRFDAKRPLDTSGLNHILKIDPIALTAIIEPNVPMDALVREALRHGLIPAVVPEFPGITVGGAFQGGAGESSSFKWGGVHNLVTEFEMILASGEVITASPEQRADLFFGSAGSYGSLGVMTAITLKLIKAAKYINLTYLPITRFEAAVAEIGRAI